MNQSLPNLYDLSGQSLRNIPQTLIKTSGTIESMFLDFNHIEELPDNLQNLKILSLKNNAITDSALKKLWNSITTYDHLSVLDLSHNCIITFPSDGNKKPKFLNYLILFNNRIESLDLVKTGEIKLLNISRNQFKHFPKLPRKLRGLDYSFNDMKVLEFNGCFKLKKLRRFYLNLTGLLSISPSMTFSLLTEIELSMNRLKEAPDFTKFSPNLESVNLSMNLLSKFPVFPSSIISIDMSYNNITEIPDDISCLYPNLETLRVSNNRIKSVPILTDKIQIIDFQHNVIDVILPMSTPNLVEMNFNNNCLKAIPQMNNSKVCAINLANNKITSLKTGFTIIGDNVDSLFSNFVSEIDLHNNRIKILPPYIFTQNVQILNIAGNKINKIPGEIMAAKKLLTLNISLNPIDQLPSKLPKSLVNLYAGYCQFQNLPEYLSTEAPNLTTLSVPGNYLTKIPFIPSLIYLYISCNNLSMLPEVPSSKIKSADLSKNKICSMNESALKEFSELEDFNISHNMLSDFPDFSPCRQLKYLRLNDNPITMTLDLFLLPNGSLEVLDISNTKIKFEHELPVKGEIISSTMIQPSSILIDNQNDEKSEDSSKEESSSSISSNNNSSSYESSNSRSNIECEVNSENVRHFEEEKCYLNVETVKNISGVAQCQIMNAFQYFEYSAYAEMRGGKNNMDDSIVCRPIVNKNTNSDVKLDLFCVFDGLGGSQTSRWLAKNIPAMFENYSNSTTLQQSYITATTNRHSDLAQVHKDEENSLADPSKSFIAKFSDSDNNGSISDLFSKKGLLNITRKLANNLMKQKFSDGSTAAIAVLSGDCAFLMNIGNARALIITQYCQVKYATTDHLTTNREEFERIVKNGGYIIKNKIGARLDVPRAFGYSTMYGMTCMPTVEKIEIMPEEDRWLILGCAGIFDVLSNEKIAAIGKISETADELAINIRNMAFSLCSSDNLSVVAVDLMKRKQVLHDE